MLEIYFTENSSNVNLKMMHLVLLGSHMQK